MGLFHWLFRRMCYRIFKAVDNDNSGYVEALEVEVAIYRLYNIINKRIPGWQDPPERSEIRAALAVYDKDGNLRLDRDEFVEFARSLAKTGPDMFFARVGRNAAYNTAALPVATKGLQYAAGAAGLAAVAAVPLHIAAPVVGSVYRAIKAVLPFGL